MNRHVRLYLDSAQNLLACHYLDTSVLNSHNLSLLRGTEEGRTHTCT